jgi:hypothetical protein
LPAVSLKTRYDRGVVNSWFSIEGFELGLYQNGSTDEVLHLLGCQTGKVEGATGENAFDLPKDVQPIGASGVPKLPALEQYGSLQLFRCDQTAIAARPRGKC